MADAFAWATAAPFTALTPANMNLARQSGAVSSVVNGFFRGADANGRPCFWDYYTTGGGVVAGTTTAGEFETCGRGVKLSGGTAELYQDQYGLLQEGWRDQYVTLKVRALRLTNNWEVLLDYGAGGTSTVLAGSALGAFEDRAITLQVPNTADKLLIVLRWTNASGSVVFDRVQLTAGQADPGWLTDAAEPPVLHEGYVDKDAATWTEQRSVRLVLLAGTWSGLNGLTSKVNTEDFTVAADYWPTGTARTDAGTAGDEVTAYVGVNGPEASNNHRVHCLPGGNTQALTGKPTAGIRSPTSISFGTGDLDYFSLVFQSGHGPDPPTRRAYPGGP